MPEYTFVSVRKETREKLYRFRDKWIELDEGDKDNELLDFMIDELERYYSQEQSD